MNLENLGNSALDRTAISSIMIPKSVTNIGGGFLTGCNELESITVESGNTKYNSRSNSNAVIETASNTLISGCKNTKIPSGVKVIGKYAFYDHIGLTSISIPNSVTDIEEGAFHGTGLISVTIPNSISQIKSRTFEQSASLETVILPNTIEIIGSSAFYGCKSLCSINFPYKLSIIGGEAFEGCESLVSIKLPNSITELKARAFGRCYNLKTIDLGSGVQKLGVQLFMSCRNFKSLFIPKSIIEINNLIIQGCPVIETLEVEEGNSIYNSQDNCNAIIETATNTLIVGCKNSIIPVGVSAIKYDAFRDCTELSSITFPYTLTSIGNQAFSGCTGLKTIYTNIIYPFEINKSVFSNATYENATLYVLEESKNWYETTSAWNSFSKIYSYDPTAIRTIKSDSLFSDNTIYSISGQLLQTLQKGLIIKNGKKALVK